MCPVNSTPAHRNSARTFPMKASSFFTELKRRKVYRVAAAYAVVSWLLIQSRIDFSADLRCTSMYDEGSRRASGAGFCSFRNSLVDF